MLNVWDGGEMLMPPVLGVHARWTLLLVGDLKRPLFSDKYPNLLVDVIKVSCLLPAILLLQSLQHVFECR